MTRKDFLHKNTLILSSIAFANWAFSSSIYNSQTKQHIFSFKETLRLGEKGRYNSPPLLSFVIFKIDTKKIKPGSIFYINLRYLEKPSHIYSPKVEGWLKFRVNDYFKLYKKIKVSFLENESKYRHLEDQIEKCFKMEKHINFGSNLKNISSATSFSIIYGNHKYGENDYFILSKSEQEVFRMKDYPGEL